MQLWPCQYTFNGLDNQPAYIAVHSRTERNYSRLQIWSPLMLLPPHLVDSNIRGLAKEQFQFFFFFWQYWGLNTGLCACSVGVYHVRHASSSFCCGYFGNGGLIFSPGQPGPWFPYLMFPIIAGMISASPHTTFSIELGSCKLFYLSWPEPQSA
jgi:hypothetical protein